LLGGERQRNQNDLPGVAKQAGILFLKLETKLEKLLKKLGLGAVGSLTMDKPTVGESTVSQRQCIKVIAMSSRSI
jgi:hypothetical protein